MTGFREELAHSGNVPLHICVDDNANPDVDVVGQLSALLDQSARWGSFAVRHPDAGILASKCLPSNLPELKELSIINSPNVTSVLYLSAEMPRLRALVINDVTLCLGDVMISQLSRLDLRRLRLSSPDAWKVVSILENCSSLETVTLMDVFGRDVALELSERQKPLMSRLRELEVSETASTSVLQWIQAPSLQKMKLTTTSRPLPLQDLQEAFSSVEDLEITDFSASMPALRSILLATSNVSRLHVRHQDFHDSFALVPDLVLQHRTWTNLSDLTLHGVFSIGQLRNVVQTHRNTLKRVGVHCLDLGLGFDSLRKEYDEHEEALEWMHHHVDFRVDHTEYVMRGDRCRTFVDQRKGRTINCSLYGCPKFPIANDQ